MKQTLNKIQPLPTKLLSEVELDITKRQFATASGKTALENLKDSLNTKNNRIHLQMFSDFEIIYTDPSDAQIFIVGNLYTKHNNAPSTVLLSNSKNVNGANKPQHLEFWKKATLVDREEVLYNTRSKAFFQDAEIRKKIQESPFYQKLRNDLIEDLNRRNVSYRVATTEEDLQKTEIYKIMENFNEEHIDSNEEVFVNNKSYPKLRRLDENKP